MARQSDDLPARVYWLVAAVAVALMVLLYGFTAYFNIPIGALGPV